MHHTCLKIKDPKVSLPFYKEVLGMKTLFTYNAGSFSIFCEFSPLSFRFEVERRELTFGLEREGWIDMYHSDEDGDTEKVWESFPTQKGLLEREFCILEAL